MNNLLAFIIKYYHWLIFLILEIVSGVMLFGYNNYQGSMWVSSSNAIAGNVYKWQSSFGQFFSLTKRSEQLTQRNIYLEERLHELRKENARLRGDTTLFLPDEKQVLSQVRWIPAKVVDNSVNNPDNLITIDRGSADGIKRDMGVVCGKGIVGVVYMVNDHYSVVLPVLNRHSHISCTIRESDYFGYLVWDGKDPAITYLEDVPRHAIIKKGYWVETSGFSTIFPPGISVGRILAIYNSPDGLSYRVKVRLSTDFGKLRDVCVFDDPSIAERARLNTAANDSLSKLK